MLHEDRAERVEGWRDADAEATVAIKECARVTRVRLSSASDNEHGHLAAKRVAAKRGVTRTVASPAHVMMLCC